MWADKDFTSLPARAQRMYMFLVSQPDLSNVGTITIASRRWANCVPDESVSDIEEDLRYLAAKSYVIVDTDCEELLIRSYLKWDGGWKSPNMMISVKASATQILSETIRASVRDELEKLDTSHLPMKVSDKTGRSTKEFIELLISQIQESLACDETDEEVLNWGINGLQDKELTHSERVKKTDINPIRIPSLMGSLTTTATAIDTTATDSTATAIDTTSKKTNFRPSRYPSDFEAFWAEYPVKDGKKKAYEAYGKAVRKIDLDSLIAAVRKYRNWLEATGTKPKFAQGWLNDERWNDSMTISPQRRNGYVNREQLKLDDQMRRIRESEQREQVRSSEQLEIGGGDNSYGF
jgi:hypothetical protein